MTLHDSYIQYGVPSNWAKEYDLLGISATTFKNTSKKNLISNYHIPIEQVDFVKMCLSRQPIDENVLQKILENSNFTCCLCKGVKSDAYIIHHIIEYSKTQDNRYSNLAVLCPNDHDIAHREGQALTNKTSEKQIRTAKSKWEKHVREENAKTAKRKTTHKIDWRQINPYKELKSYSEADCNIFFGRETETTELLEKIFRYNIVGLFGESGTGKTSLVNAGLIPKLKSEPSIIVSVRCLDEPIKRVRESLLKLLKVSKISDDNIERIAISDSFQNLVLQLKILVETENRIIVFIIDQFEELFTRAGENERQQLSKGIIECLISPTIKGKIFFLLSIREDYLGDLWDWSHKYNLEDAWIHQYRIKRLSRDKAFEVIVEPLKRVGIDADSTFIENLITDLTKIGDGLIYPPYLQILCSELFEEYKLQNSLSKLPVSFEKKLLKKRGSVENIIGEYLSESMLVGLTAEEKVVAQNILDLLTGPNGLRNFLNIEEISKYVSCSVSDTKHVINHLVSKKIVHAIVETDNLTGYELVHDFLSKKFFEKLSPEAKKAKTTAEILRIALRDWKLHGVLASKDRLRLLFDYVGQLKLNEEEWTFLIKSSFSVYYSFENKWVDILNESLLSRICRKLLIDADNVIVENSIEFLAKVEGVNVADMLIEIIESNERTDSIREQAIRQFWSKIKYEGIIPILKRIISYEKNYKLRKISVSALASQVQHFGQINPIIITEELQTIYKALYDSKTDVRKQAADTLSFYLVVEQNVGPLLECLKSEKGISVRKNLVSGLNALLRRKKVSIDTLVPVLKEISENTNEDYRVREEAQRGLSFAKYD